VWSICCKGKDNEMLLSYIKTCCQYATSFTILRFDAFNRIKVRKKILRKLVTNWKWSLRFLNIVEHANAFLGTDKLNVKRSKNRGYQGRWTAETHDLNLSLRNMKDWFFTNLLDRIVLICFWSLSVFSTDVCVLGGVIITIAASQSAANLLY
jgi:hypothetical protein